MISTGAELREPGSRLGDGQIYDSNSYTLAACARDAGAVAYRVGIVDDDPKRIMDTLSDQLVRADLVITTGGVSMGAYDIVKEELSKLGTVDFPQVAMQPGKPQGFGVIGEDEVPIFTLPGNPVSAYISFEVFVRPALRKMMGQMPYRRSLVPGVTLDGFSSPAGRRQFVRAAATSGDEGWMASTVGGHGSHLLGGLSRANALIVVPEDVTSVRAGDQVELMVAGQGDWMTQDPGATTTGSGTPGPGGLTHVDEAGAARMVDVSAKDATVRRAVASGKVLVSAEVVAALRGDGVPKGDALGVARIAGIMGAKRTPDLVPLCHPIAITGAKVDLEVADDAVLIQAQVKTTDRTGVEMEALTAVAVAGLAVIDMVKALDPAAVLTDVRVELKEGGKTGHWERP